MLHNRAAVVTVLRIDCRTM